MERIYTYKTEPFKHQREVFEATRDMKSYALFWEQGTGKTKTLIDTATWQYEGGTINMVLVVAPKSVHRQWIDEELPKHMPDRVLKRAVRLAYYSEKAGTAYFQRELDNLRRAGEDTLVILAVPYSSLITKKFEELVHPMLKKRKVMLILDESHAIQTPSAARTRAVMRLKPETKRIATGTPLGNGPFGAFTQFKFLAREFWAERDLRSFGAFKSYFGDLYQHPDGYEIVRGYRRLDELADMIQPLSSRVTKEECLDLPPKLYSKLPYSMNRQQVLLYRQLRKECVAQLASGTTITADNILTMRLRLYQIACGYVPTGDSQEPYELITPKKDSRGGGNPRLDAGVAHAEQFSRQGIIWCRFQHDITQIVDALGEHQAARFDGFVDDEVAERNKQRFVKGDAKYLVSNPMKGSAGLNLQMAKHVLYYSNWESLTLRLQSEDRAHRAGMDEVPVDITDVVCEDSGVDVGIVENLRKKRDIASLVLGDDPTEWI